MSLDPELHAHLADLPTIPPLTVETLAQIRPFAAPTIEPLLEGRAVEREELSIDGSDGQVPLTVLRPTGPRPANAPCVYWIHGGGMIMGNRFSEIDIPLEWLDKFGAVVVSVEYRLAPEAQGTAPVDDCYTGLVWIAEHAAELGIDPSLIIVAGVSAGGGLAAGVTLMARDRGTVPIAGQVLIGPMLDHRNSTTSSRQFSGQGVWTREMNEFGWRCLLGGLDDDISPYVSPSLAGDLSALPPTYIDGGSEEVFRDESVDYATRIWAAGGHSDLHIWAGGFHGFDALFPTAALSAAARATRIGWLARLLDAKPA
ncbi:alpha/beta hydrolase [Amycolatopsis pithecellobii]|uniref:Alpha/beta hydrolase fold domain-containing protein n=1 Tax=Amycolatopsis pithecellobii TaxID=664692 RepID=A0A6N7Z233_9PSEU|nr:alpha/beta hydrolase [Amycolatopsis pithecellobii]MTD55613.1 alpha/beta hydrolase fold domain-containing protein [Amycolatopsis pithecellobii]